MQNKKKGNTSVDDEGHFFFDNVYKHKHIVLWGDINKHYTYNDFKVGD